MMISPGPEAARKLLNFVNASPTPFHAVHAASTRLEEAGFRKIFERDNWETVLKAGGKYYFTRNQSAILAFTLPAKWKAGAGLSIIATHIDSPNLRVRPVSKRSEAGFLQVGVETYGGGIWHSWFDRDLSVAGRVVLADKNGGFISKLVRINDPILRIPTLAIHLDRNVNRSFEFNQETEFIPILGQIESQLNSAPDAGAKATEKSSNGIQGYHHPALLSLLATELSVAAEDIHSFELQLYDTQPSILGGVSKEFVFSPRMDNQFCSYAALEALSNYATSEAFGSTGEHVNCIALFNHEEIGSVSSSGAQSSLIPLLLKRLSPTPETYAQSVAQSFLVSADMGHAVHPNYKSKHEANHAPKINGGVILKTNASQNYTTDAIGSFVIDKLVAMRGGNVQQFEARNDMPCGSTVGPALSTIGVRTVDIGWPMLSMHSIRETAGAHDVQDAVNLFTSFFENFSDLDKQLTAE